MKIKKIEGWPWSTVKTARCFANDTAIPFFTRTYQPLITMKTLITIITVISLSSCGNPDTLNIVSGTDTVVLKSKSPINIDVSKAKASSGSNDTVKKIWTIRLEPDHEPEPEFMLIADSMVWEMRYDSATQKEKEIGVIYQRRNIKWTGLSMGDTVEIMRIKKELPSEEEPQK